VAGYKTSSSRYQYEFSTTIALTALARATGRTPVVPEATNTCL